MRHITADLDPESGRVSIRVDGRMAARPMTADEDERAFSVGSVTYVVRRNGAELDLDIAPPQIQAGRPAATPPPSVRAKAATVQGKKPLPVFRIIGSIAVTVLLAIGVRWGTRYVTYMNVPWKSYTHPDRMFRVNFAGLPEKKTNAIGNVRTMQLKSSYEGHFYVVEFVEFPDVMPVEAEMKIVDEMFAAVLKAEQWTPLKRDWSNRGLNFMAEVPKSKDWSEGTARGSFIPHRDRVYIVYAFVPRGEALGWDVGEFLRSLELAE